MQYKLVNVVIEGNLLIRYIAENEDSDFTIHEAPSKAYLVLLSNGRISHSFPLRDEKVQVGRDKSNSVVVADQKVSRHHVSLSPIDDTFIVTDKGSANGTYLNGVLISHPIRLKDKDRITVGDTTFLFSTDISSAELALMSDSNASAASLPVYLPQPQNSKPINNPIWLLIGCLGLVIVGLLIILAAALGLFLGSSQIIGALLIWQIGVF